MLTIVADTVGRHDFLYTPCSRETFTLIYNHQGPHPSCFDNLSRGLAAFGIEPDGIPTTFNIFMNVDVGAGRTRQRSGRRGRSPAITSSCAPRWTWSSG